MESILVKRRIIVIMTLLSMAVIPSDKNMMIKQYSYQYDKTEDTLYNPMMGFAPNADYIEAVGDNTLVYVGLTWREWEPEEGKYDIASVVDNNYLKKWRKLNKKVVFRFICDYPSDKAHWDIPDWLYEKTADGTDYDTDYGKGYSPNYSNKTFIEAHAKAIRALGKAFGQDSFVCYVELGSIGHWGEWHVKYDDGINRIPSAKVCEQYILPYIEAFPHAKLMMRRPFEAVKKHELGVFNDMAGDKDDTLEWLDWIKSGGTYDEPEVPHKLVACPNIWQYSPIGGEFTSGISMEELLDTNLNCTLKLLQQSHMTFIGEKCPVVDEVTEYTKGTAAVLAKIGYRYGVRTCDVEYNTYSDKAKLHLVLENSGVAPIYKPWPVYLYFMDDKWKVLSKERLDIDLCKLYQNQTKGVTVTFQSKKGNGIIKHVGIGVEDPDTGKPSILLDMKCKRKDKISILY